MCVKSISTCVPVLVRAPEARPDPVCQRSLEQRGHDDLAIKLTEACVGVAPEVTPGAEEVPASLVGGRER